MNIADLFKAQFIFSFEVYPPKKTAPIEVVYRAVEGLSQLAPDYISVTYGASGTAATAASTVEIASLIQNTYGIESVAHLPGINLTRQQVESLLQRLRAHKIGNILALRGDRRPEDDERVQEGDFDYASDLIAYIKELETDSDDNSDDRFNIIAACYPEVHDEAADAQADLANLKVKVDAGATQLVSQLFFDNESYYRFLDKARNMGIVVPIQAGIMPLTNVRQSRHIIKLCNPSVPSRLQAIIDKYIDDDESFRKAGIDYAVTQIADLIEQDIDGVHLYTMNSPKTAAAITQQIYPLLNR
ncbi:MAG: methylenetetrahydrofolate reductase [NAD(P)H] [Coriobacteriia bacterium]|nr:methylenetetrahydrofolate reductase [NAD(P)H] [Coriobacteriia bacterium]